MDIKLRKKPHSQRSVGATPGVNKGTLPTIELIIMTEMKLFVNLF